MSKNDADETMDRFNFLIGAIVALLLIGGLISWGILYMVNEQGRNRELQRTCLTTNGTWVKGMCLDRLQAR